MTKFESSWKDESRAQSADSSKAFTATRELSIVDVRRVIFTVDAGHKHTAHSPVARGAFGGLSPLKESSYPPRIET